MTTTPRTTYHILDAHDRAEHTTKTLEAARAYVALFPRRNLTIRKVRYHGAHPVTGKRASTRTLVE